MPSRSTVYLQALTGGESFCRHKQRICERLHSENKADQRLRCCTEDMCNIAGDAAVALELDRRTARVKNSSLGEYCGPCRPQLTRAGGDCNTASPAAGNTGHSDRLVSEQHRLLQ